MKKVGLARQIRLSISYVYMAAAVKKVELTQQIRLSISYIYMAAAVKKVGLARQIRLSISYGCSREESCIDSADQTIHIVCIWMQQGRKLDLLSRSDYPYRIYIWLQQ